MAHKTPEVILGAGGIGESTSSYVKITSVAATQELLDIAKKHNLKTIDTSRNYPPGAPGTSEEFLGQTDVKDWAVIDTKARGGADNYDVAGISESVTGSLKALKIPQINVQYLHFPERAATLEETLKGINDEYRAGHFKKFGISNYAITEVREIVDICKKNGYVLPSVYQGQYNPVARRAEDGLLPVLRENGIAYYAYSPAAGGLFNGSNTRLGDKGLVGTIYRSIYGTDGTADAIAKVIQLAGEHGIPGHETALRWILHHSALDGAKGDAIIVGASSPQQLESTLTSTEQGPLPKDLVDAIEEVWVQAKPTAPAYSPWASVEHEGASDFVMTDETAP